MTGTGLEVLPPSQVLAEAANAAAGNVALSLTDFDNFRIKVVDAINKLDQKIRDILMTTAPECPTLNP